MPAGYGITEPDRLGSTRPRRLGPGTRADPDRLRRRPDRPPPAARAHRRPRGPFAQGTAGYPRDTVLASARWPFDPGAVRVPVDLWYGAQDTSPVHSPDFGASLAGRIPGARRHLLADAGGALLWTHTEPILRTLLRR